jgi:hypothetical protein
VSVAAVILTFTTEPGTSSVGLLSGVATLVMPRLMGSTSRHWPWAR